MLLQEKSITVLENERKGVYAGSTVQMIPHITNMIQDKIANMPNRIKRMWRLLKWVEQ